MIDIDSGWYNNLTQTSPPEIWQTFVGHCVVHYHWYFNFCSNNIEIYLFKKTYGLSHWLYLNKSGSARAVFQVRIILVGCMCRYVTAEILCILARWCGKFTLPSLPIYIVSTFCSNMYAMKCVRKHINGEANCIVKQAAY